MGTIFVEGLGEVEIAGDIPTEEESKAIIAATEKPSALENAGRSLARGVIAGAALPLEAGQFIAEKLGVPGAEDADPTKRLEDAANEFGVRTDPNPQNATDRFTSNFSEALGSTVGFGGPLVAASKAARNAVIKNPKSFAAEEIVSNVLGSGARTSIEEGGGNAASAAVGEFTANFLTGTIIDKARRAVNFINAAPEAASRAKESSFNEAARRIQSKVSAAGDDPKELAQQFRDVENAEGNLTSFELSESPALSRILLAHIDADPAMKERFANSRKSVKDFVRDEMTAVLGEGVPQDAVDAFIRSNEFQADALEKSLQIANRKVQEKLVALPDVDGSHAEELNEAFQAAKRKARDLEKDKYLAITDEPIQSTSLSGALDEVDAMLSRSEKISGGGIDTGIKQALEDFAEEGSVSVGELMAERSTILSRQAEARAAGNSRLAAQYDILQDAILDTLKTADSPNADAINEARAFSVSLNDTFTRGPIGAILKAKKDRSTLAANETLEKLFKPGESGRTIATQVKAAFNGETPKELTNYIMQQFHKRVVTEKGIDAVAGERFLSKYGPLIQETGLNNLITANIQAGKAAAQAQRNLDRFTSASAKSAAQRALKAGSTPADLTRQLQGMISGKTENIGESFKEMFEVVADDPEATGGLKAAISEAVLDSVFTKSDDFSKSTKFLRPRITGALASTGKFSEEEVNRVDRLLRIATKVAKSDNTKTIPGRSNTAEDLVSINNVAGTLFKIMGLKKLAPAVAEGPGSLAISGTIGRISEKLGRKITSLDAESVVNAAVFDQDLMASLLAADVELDSASVNSIVRIMKTAGKVGAGIATGGLNASQAQILNTESSRFQEGD